MPILESNADRPAQRSVSLTTGLGIIFGLFFGLPPAFEMRAMGLAWVPFGFAVLLAGMLVGHSLAYLVVTFLIRSSSTPCVIPTLPHVPVLQPLRAIHSDAPVKRSASLVRKRLAEEHVTLERLDAERARRHDSRFGIMTEQRIIWGELLDLELQDIDEQVDRIRHTAGGPA